MRSLHIRAVKFLFLANFPDRAHRRAGALPRETVGTSPPPTGGGKKEAFFMFGLGIPELILILIIGLLFFGPGKLAESGKALGKSVREFREAASEDGAGKDGGEKP